MTKTAAPSEAQQEKWPEGVAHDDPLMRALEFIANHHALPFSPDVALQGIPTADGKINLSTFEDAAERLGLTSRILERQPSQVPEIVCPYIVLFKNGDVGVVTDKGSGLRRLTVLLPGLGSSKKMSARAIDKACEFRVVYVTPSEHLADTTTESQNSATRKGHWLWATVRRFWPSWTQVIVAALFINILGLALPLFVMNVYDRVIGLTKFDRVYII